MKIDDADRQLPAYGRRGGFRGARTATAYVESHLRSLDAVHLATAEQLVAAGKGISAFVTHDEGLAEAARACSLPVAAPGVGV